MEDSEGGGSKVSLSEGFNSVIITGGHTHTHTHNMQKSIQRPDDQSHLIMYNFHQDVVPINVKYISLQRYCDILTYFALQLQSRTSRRHPFVSFPKYAES